MTPRRDQRGVGTLMVVGMCLVLVVVAYVSTGLAGWWSEALRTKHAADLVALAGASAAVQHGEACDAASVVARRNRVELVDCQVRSAGASVVVEISVSAHLKPALLGITPRVKHAAAASSQHSS